jgi:hypothetical protein
MIQKLVPLFAVFALSNLAVAHDEGHGPKVNDQPEHGGKVVAVVLASEASKHAGAKLVHKAELEIKSDEAAQVYLYADTPSADGKLVPLKLDGFAKEAKGKLFFKKSPKDKKPTSKDFKLTLDEATGSYKGTMPAHGKPFDFDFTVKGGGKELLAAFDNND